MVGERPFVGDMVGWSDGAELPVVLYIGTTGVTATALGASVGTGEWMEDTTVALRPGERRWSWEEAVVVVVVVVVGFAASDDDGRGGAVVAAASSDVDVVVSR
jgi:hypothetical protein